MAVTYQSPVIIGDVTLIRVTSDLGGTVYFHWYVDGSYVGMSVAGEWRFTLPAGVEAEIVCQDTTDADYDAIANAPDGYPATRTLQLIRSLSADVSQYRIEEQKDGGDWTAIATVDDDGSWFFLTETSALDDLSTYAHRAVPIDEAGNDGTPLTLGTAKVVRRPAAPDWEYSFDSGTNRTTFSEAS